MARNVPHENITVVGHSKKGGVDHFVGVVCTIVGSGACGATGGPGGSSLGIS